MNNKVSNLSPLFANLSKPFLHLDGRRFEQLVYSLFKKDIDNKIGSIGQKYDEIKLMSGRNEKGIDHALYSGKKMVGMVQCKNYNKPLEVSECLKEIIKPFLHYTNKNLIIEHIENFEYYLVTGDSLANKTIEMLDDFSAYIETNEPEIIKAITKLKREFRSFESLNYEVVKDDLHYALKAIKITTIDGEVLKNKLDSKEYIDIKNNFFSLSVVTDNSEIIKLRDDITKNVITPKDIVDKFEIASLQLQRHPNVCELDKKVHITRKEVGEIIDWVNIPISEDFDPVLLLVGEPGMGKSAILKNVYDELHANNINVIGLKADRYYIHSVSELQQRTNLPCTIEECVKVLLKTSEKVIVLIDQIDAVSQFVTTKRDCIDTYQQIISSLKKISGVRIIISIRKFDLEYDYEFSEFKNKKFQKITVEPLTKDEVISVIKNLNLHFGEQLYSLLKVPNHLSIFCKVYSKNQRRAINTLHDLYNELWDQKIGKDKVDVGEKILDLAEEMHQSHSLIFPSNQIAKDIFSKVIQTGLFIEQDGYICFFHQTFFEYCFAKSFLRNKKSLIDYLHREKQSLFVRSTLKTVLFFLRENNDEQYKKIIKELLGKDEYRWHIKFLVLNLLAYQETPSVDEIAIVRNDILTSSKFFLPFLDSVRGTGWLQILIEQNILFQLVHPKTRRIEKVISMPIIKKILKIKGANFYLFKTDFNLKQEQSLNIWYRLLKINLPINRILVLKYLKSLTEFKNKNAIVLHVLWSLKIWDSEIAIQVYEENVCNSSEWFLRLNLLEDAAPYQPEWVLKTLCINLSLLYKSKPNELKSVHHTVDATFKILEEKIPEECFSKYLEFICSFINKEKLDELFSGKLYSDDLILSFDINDEYPSDKEWFLHRAMHIAQKLGSQNNTIFKQFVNDIFSEHSITLLSIALVGMTANPNNYCEIAIQLIENIGAKNGLHEEAILFFVRKLITAIFPHLNSNSKTRLGNFLLEIKGPNDLYIYEYQGKKRLRSNYGLIAYQYICAIPESERAKLINIKNRYAELNRKYGPLPNLRYRRSFLQKVPPPLTSQAYSNMPLKEWEKNLYLYNDKFKSDLWPHKGDIEQHEIVFRDEISKRPVFFMPLIEKIVDENIVSARYQVMALEGLRLAKFDVHKVLILFKKIKDNNQDHHTTSNLTYLAEYFLIQKVYDKDIFSFLVQIVQNSYSNFDSTQHLSCQQYAMFQIMCFYGTDFTNDIYQLIETTSSESSVGIRTIILNNLVSFANFESKKKAELFRRLISSNDPEEIFQASFNLANHLIKFDFNLVSTFLKNAVSFDACKSIAAKMLAVNWLEGNQKCLPLLKDFWNDYSLCRAAMIDISLQYRLNPKKIVQRNSKWLFEKFLSDDEKEVIHEYEVCFLHLEARHFQQYYPLLKKYATSSMACKLPGYYFEYLLKCYSNYPNECISLLKYSVNYESHHVSTSGYYNPDMPTKILVGSYNLLCADPSKNRKGIKKSISLFDKYLQHPIFRTAAEDVTNTL